MSLFESTGVAGTGRAAFQNLLKTVHGPLWQLHVHTKVVIWSLIAKPKGRMGGKATLHAVVHGLPQSAGIALLEDYELPTARSLKAFSPEVFCRDLYLKIQHTGQVERAARGGDVNAWAQPVQYEMQLARQQFQLNIARMAYTGPFQILGQIAEAYEADGAQTITLEPRNTRSSTANDFWHFGAHYMREGQSLGFLPANDADGDPTNTMIGKTEEVYIIDGGIDDSDPAQPRVTIDNDPGVSPVDNGYIVPFASRRDTITADTASKESYFAGINGLANMITDTNIYDTLYSLDRADYPTLQGRRSNDGGANRPFSERFVSMVVDNICDKGTGTEPNNLVCHRSIRREVVKELRDLRQFPVIQTESGFGRLVFQSGDTRLPYITDRDCPPGLVWVLDTRVFGWLTNSNLGPLESGDRRFVLDKDAREMHMHMSGNMFCTAPYANGVLEDIQYDVEDLIP